jgi:NADH-quinone oxidoreductase subunit J
MNAFFAWIAENRAMLVPPVFGFLALYLLLPREYRFWRPIGLAFGVVALGVLGYLFSVPGVSLDNVLFYLFAGLAIIAAAATVTFPNPIYSALSFALVVLSVSGLFVLRGALFLAATTVIIYAGAIVVMFLFIIMLSRHPGNAPYDLRAREPFLGSLAAFLLLSVLVFTLADWTKSGIGPSHGATARELAAADPLDVPPRSRSGFIPIPNQVDPYRQSHVRLNEPSALRGLGRTLFTDYLFVVELAGTLLLVAGVGAVAIAPRRVRAPQRPPTA